MQTVRTEGDGPVREQLATGRGAIMFLGHLGNWDTGGAWSTTQLAPVTTVAERLRPEELFERVPGLPRVARHADHPADRRQRRLPRAAAALRGGAFVAAARRPRPDPGRRRGRPVREPARMAVGPAALAVATGAALHPVSVFYEPATGLRGGRRHRVVIRFHDRVPGAGGRHARATRSSR